MTNDDVERTLAPHQMQLRVQRERDYAAVLRAWEARRKRRGFLQEQSSIQRDRGDALSSGGPTKRRKVLPGTTASQPPPKVRETIGALTTAVAINGGEGCFQDVTANAMQIMASARGRGWGTPTAWNVLFPFLWVGLLTRAQSAPPPQPTSADIWFMYSAPDDGVLSLQTSVQIYGRANAYSETHFWASVGTKLKFYLDWAMYQTEQVNAAISLIDIDAQDISYHRSFNGDWITLPPLINGVSRGPVSIRVTATVAAAADSEYSWADCDFCGPDGFIFVPAIWFSFVPSSEIVIL